MTRHIDRGRSRRSRNAAGDAPRFIRPMECMAVADLPGDRSRWIYEVKLDGYRCCAVVRNGRAELFSRYGNRWADRFHEIHDALSKLPDTVLDGEIVAVDRAGRPSFQELQNWQSTRHLIVFYAFDILHLEGRDLRALPIEERKRILDDAGSSFADPLRVSAILDAPLKKLVPQMKRLGLEGLVAKRLGSRYESRRSAAWQKQRFNETGEFVIGGYIPEDDTFSRLLIGEWRDGKLHFVKKLKNGFNPLSRREVMDAIAKSRTKRCPFVNLPERAGRGAVDAEVMKTVVWVRPVRAVEVDFVEWTSGGRLRHAAFRRLIGRARK